MRDWSAAAIRRAIDAGESTITEVVGGSMHPLLRHGTRLMLSPVRDPDLRIGAVVAIPVGDALAVHRIIEVDGALVRTKGDAAACADTPIPRASVVALATAFELRPGIWLPMWPQRIASRLLRLLGRPS